MTQTGPKQHGPPDRWLLVSDMDDTLTGDERALADFVHAVRATPELMVAINSSRPLASIDHTLAGFPEGFNPHAVIGAMGTEVRIGGEVDAGWIDRFANWNRNRLDEVLAGLGHTPHSPDLQTRFKVSYTVPPASQQEAIEAIEATGLAVQIVISGEDAFDVIPQAAGKAAAIRHLLERFQVPLETGLLVAGDSANDIAMFELCQRGIVVGNARDELREAVDPARVHFAKGERAAGVLEGLDAWGVPLRLQRPG
jgi:sucrose-6F-phosphate phosphohydrolase